MLENRISKRKPTGGLRNTRRRRDKKLSKLANPPTDTTVSEKTKRINYRGKGANEKVKSYALNKINLVLEGKNVSAEVVSVTKSLANKEYSRRNILTKGAEIKVKYKDKEYNAKITSRPGQTGVVSAIVIQ